MTNPIVRASARSLPDSPAEGERVRCMHWDPLRPMTPFATGEALPARIKPDFESKETKEGFVFKADLPGAKEKHIEITMTGDRLTTCGGREAGKGEATDTYYALECSYGAFTRPAATERNDSIRAQLASGVLTLHLQERPELQPKRIEVKVRDKPKS